ncbi:MAG: hypothetical protein RSD67_08455 [Oscillospiraceae bacterium]
MYQSKVFHKIATVMDMEHYEKWLKSKGYEFTTSAQLEYLDCINSDKELFAKYFPAYKEKIEKNIANNYGADWKKIYDFDFDKGYGTFKEGYSVKDVDGLVAFLDENPNTSSLNVDRDRFADYKSNKNK